MIDLILKILDKIFLKYKNVILVLYGIVGIYFMSLMISFTKNEEKRNYMFDVQIVSKAVEKINKDRKDFKEADLPYINMVCASYTLDFSIQRNCKVIEEYLDSLNNINKFNK